MEILKMKMLFLIGAAGAAGTLFRLALVRLTERFLPGFPWGTLAVNLLGAFWAGWCFEFGRGRFLRYEAYFPILFIGFFGAFTTFSTFALESARFLLHAEYGRFAANVLMQNLCGLAAAAGGIVLARWMCRVL